MLITRKQILILAIVVEAGLGGLAVIGGWWWNLPMGEWVRWSGTGIAWGMAGTAILLGILGLCRRFPVGPIGRLMRLVEDGVKPLFRECRVGDLLVIAILAGIGEELLFRGLIQGGLAAWLEPSWGSVAGQTVGLGVASVLFGLAHFISREYAGFAAALGLLLGWLAIASGDLLAPIIAHGGYDFFALLWLTKETRGEEGGV